MGLSFKTRRDHNKDYAKLPFLWRIVGDVLPNKAFIRSLLKGALVNSGSISVSGMDAQHTGILPTPNKGIDPAKETYESDYISAVEAGLMEIMEDCQTESKNREMIQLANLKYGRVSQKLAHLKGLNLKVLQMLRVLEAMIEHETDPERK